LWLYKKYNQGTEWNFSQLLLPCLAHHVEKRAGIEEREERKRRQKIL
jgi:hypothetical protein